MVRRRRKEGIPRHEIAAAITATLEAMETPNDTEPIQRSTCRGICTNRVSLSDESAGLKTVRHCGQKEGSRIACACRAASTQQSQDMTEQSRSAMSWGYAAAGAFIAGVAGSHVAHAEAEVHASGCSASLNV